MEYLTTDIITYNATTAAVVPLRTKPTIPATGREETALEVALFALVYIVFILWIYVGNGLTIYLLLATNERFKHAASYVRCAYAVDDILMNTFTNVSHVVALLSGYSLSSAACRAFADLAIGIAMGNIYFPSFVAVERYFFFCRPFQHERFFTLKVVVGVSCVLIAAPLVWSIAVDLHTPRVFSSTILVCQLPNQRPWLVPQVCMFVAPSILGTVFSATMIRRLQSRAQSRVEPSPPPPSPSPQPSTNQQPAQVKVDRQQLQRSIKKGLRLILLISGAFWGTLIQSWALRVSVLVTGVTFEQLDSRVDFTKFLLMRGHILLWGYFSAALNPVIYFALHRDLRVAARRLFGLPSQQFTWEKEMADVVMNQSNRGNNV